MSDPTSGSNNRYGIRNPSQKQEDNTSFKSAPSSTQQSSGSSSSSSMNADRSVQYSSSQPAGTVQIPSIQVQPTAPIPSAQPPVPQPSYNYGPQTQQPYSYGLNTQPSLPVAIPAQPINPTQSYAAQQAYAQMTKKKGNRALIVGLIFLFVALIALGVTLFIVFDPLGLFDDSIKADPPTQAQVENAYKESDGIAEEILESFQYIDTANPKTPTFSNITIGDIKQNENGNKEVYCDTSAVVEVQNNAVKASANLTMRMNYDKDSKEWKSEQVHVGSSSGQPLAPPDIEKIEENIFTLLRAYDSAAALTFANSEVTTESSLDTKGGVAAFTLKKTDEATGEERSCTINTTIDWDTDNGWMIKIDSVDGLDEEETPTQPEEDPATPEEPAQPSESGDSTSGSNNTSTSSGSSGSSNAGNPTMLLVCYSGDLVQVPGVIEFEGSSILLRTDHVIRVEFNGQVFITTYFELRGNGSWYRGEHTTVIGEISATGSLAKAPLAINVDYD